MIGAGRLPEPVSLIEKVTPMSNKTALAVQWSEVQDSDLPVTGYKL
jgi:hypothetical protein